MQVFGNQINKTLIPWMVEHLWRLARSRLTVQCHRRCLNEVSGIVKPTFRFPKILFVLSFVFFSRCFRAACGMANSTAVAIKMPRNWRPSSGLVDFSVIWLLTYFSFIAVVWIKFIHLRTNKPKVGIQIFFIDWFYIYIAVLYIIL